MDGGDDGGMDGREEAHTQKIIQKTCSSETDENFAGINQIFF